MSSEIVVCLKKNGNRDLAGSLANKLLVPLSDNEGGELTVVFDGRGVSLTGYGLSYQGDFEGMLHRVTEGRLQHEMLVRAVKTNDIPGKAVDATAGMGEDAFLIAAYGYEVTLFEQNPVIAVLLKDAIRRAKKNPSLKEAAERMHLVEGNSEELLPGIMDEIDVVYLDPMFPKRQKSGLINKKLQLIQKLEPPCSSEDALFDAALRSGASRIIVKRPLKAPNLAGKSPTFVLNGKAIRYDCYEKSPDK